VGHLDEHTRRRIAAALLVIGIVVAALAIADVGPFSDPPTDEERAQAAVERFFGAAADGDFKTFCALFTKEARVGVEQRAGALAAEQDLEGCEQILEALAGKQFRDSELNVVEVSVSGPSARVETELKLKGEPGKQQRSVMLTEVDGKWRVSDPGFG